jgi:ribulose bisphosphate carboxylase small subunit
MKRVAIDVDALFTGTTLRENASQAVRDMLSQGYRFVWVTNDTHEYVRKAEVALGLDRQWQTLDKKKAESLALAKDTMFQPGEVVRLIGCLPEDRMDVYMDALPCNNYVLFESDTLEWMITPPICTLDDE